MKYTKEQREKLKISNLLTLRRSHKWYPRVNIDGDYYFIESKINNPKFV